MTKGKQWTAREEAELKKLVEEKNNVEQIASKLQKTPGAIIIKCQRLGLKLQTQDYTDAAIKLPKNLPSIEEVLKTLGGALKSAAKPGLNKVEVQRLQAIATISKTYKELVTDYINYREIEKKLKEMEELNAQLLKEAGAAGANHATERNPAQMADPPSEP